LEPLSKRAYSELIFTTQPIFARHTPRHQLREQQEKTEKSVYAGCQRIVQCFYAFGAPVLLRETYSFPLFDRLS
jgi:hypothetical protein